MGIRGVQWVSGGIEHFIQHGPTRTDVDTLNRGVVIKTHHHHDNPINYKASKGNLWSVLFLFFFFFCIELWSRQHLNCFHNGMRPVKWNAHKKEIAIDLSPGHTMPCIANGFHYLTILRKLMCSHCPYLMLLVILILFNFYHAILHFRWKRLHQ